jgi:hypothetical protein
MSWRGLILILATGVSLLPLSRLCGRGVRGEGAVGPETKTALTPGPSPAKPGEGRTEIDFERHVVSVFSRAGCNTGACHGSFQGKGGLRLSLFGHEPDRDYRALTRDAGGRRVDPYDSDHCLLLLKATGQVSHGGGRRIAPDSWQYQVLRDWIAGGCRHLAGSGTVVRLEVEPREVEMAIHGSADLRVRANFTDGSSDDVAKFCEFRAKDESVAEVSDRGRVTAIRPGDTAIIVAYRGTTQAMRVFVPAAGTRNPQTESHNGIDGEVLAKLRRLNIERSGLATDEEFLRRVTIDTTGGLPTPAEVRAFLADHRPDKRARKIDELLNHPRHAALWASRFCDITGCNVDTLDGPPELRVKQAQMWHNWFRVRVAANISYDKIVRGVLLATSREQLDVKEWIERERKLDQAARAGFVTPYAERPMLDLFWRRVEGEDFFPLEKMAELTAAAFLGVRLECAQCHKHPFDRWTQVDYRGYANIFGKVRFGTSPELTAALSDKLGERRTQPPDEAGPAIPRMREVYVTDQRRRALPHPDGRQILPPKPLGGPELPEAADPREPLFEWMVKPDNPYFARSFVNRVWAHYFGVGLVDPVDDFSAANPSSNDRLLDLLAREFIASGFDIRRLERDILNSRSYQLTATPTANNRGDRANYSHSYARPMTAEVVLDVLNDALGSSEDFGSDAPPHSRAIEVASNRVKAPHAARVFRIFGRPARTTTCDCERSTGPILPQTLYVMSDPELLRKLTDGRLKSLLAAKMTDEALIDELFLATLCRVPDDGEKQAALEQVKTAEARAKGFVDILWALINTREFILNH